MSLNAMMCDMQSPNPFKSLDEKKAIIERYVQDLRDMLQELQGVTDESHYSELFGTPERAARTMAGKCCDCLECVIVDACEYGEGEGCHLDNYDALLEWLRGDA